MINEDEMLNEIGKMLVGRTVESVRWLSSDDARRAEWNHRPIIITLDDGKEILPMNEDHSNAGILWTNRACIIPSVRVTEKEQK